MDDEQPGMTMHLRLLVEQAEEALHQQDGLRAQADIVAVDMEQARTGPMRRLLARIGQRRQD